MRHSQKKEIRKKFSKRFPNGKSYGKVRDHCHFTGKYRGTAHSICNLRFNLLSKISLVFYKDSNYEYHFIIKELANEFEGQFERLEKTQKSTKLFLFWWEEILEKLIKMVTRIL